MRKFILGLSITMFFLSNANAEGFGYEELAQKGKVIFESKGCALCHKEKKELIGPSVIKISTSYAAKPDQLLSYLSSQGTPIIYPDRAPVMNPQLAKIKTLSEEKMKALATYLISASDRPRQR